MSAGAAKRVQDEKIIHAIGVVCKRVGAKRGVEMK
jgi:hypothetical protein